MTAVQHDAHRRSGATAVACTLSLVLAVTVVLLARWGPDWPAQEFRAWIAVHDGLQAWTTRWYGGTSLPGYSILFPAFGAVLGVGVVGVLSVVVASWAAMSMAPAGRVRAMVFAVAVAAALTQNLVIGQVPYLLGVAFGAVAVRVLLRGRHEALGLVSAGLVTVLSLCCALASPLAGASLLIVVPSFVTMLGRRALLLGTALAGIGVSTLLGGAGGFFPFDAKTLAALVAFCVIGLVFGRPLPRPLLVFLVGYCLVALGFFFVPTAVGGNIVRLLKLVAVPLAVRFAPVGTGWAPRALVRRALAAALVVAAGIWPMLAFTSSVTNGADDPSQRSGYYAGLLGFLHTQDPLAGRLEIPFTSGHWESMWVATAYPIARGWERQTDLADNAVLYHPLSAQRYRHWLDDNAVSLVALPAVGSDYGGKAEALLLRTPPPYLTPVWSDAHWRVWRVASATPLVSGTVGRLTTLRGDTIELSFTRPGEVLVREHADRLWSVSSGAACLAADDTGWLRVTAARPGPVVLSAGIGHVLLGSHDCVPR